MKRGFAVLLALLSMGLGEWRVVENRTPVSVTFRTSITNQEFVTDPGGAALRWVLTPQMVHCGSLYTVQVKATGWVPGIDADAALPMSGVSVEATCGSQRRTAATNARGEATLTFPAPDRSEVQTVTLTSPGGRWFVEPARKVGSYVYAVDWLTFTPTTKRGRAGLLDPIGITARVVKRGVTGEGYPYEGWVELPDDDRLAEIRLTAASAVRFEHEGRTGNGRMEIRRTRSDGNFDFAVRGQLARREEIAAAPGPKREGIRFTVPLCNPTDVLFIDRELSGAQAFDIRLRPAGASSRGVTENADGSYLVDLGRFPVGQLIDPPRELRAEAVVPVLGNAPAALVPGRYEVTKGRVSLVGDVSPRSDSSGILYGHGRRIPSAYRVDDLGENLVEVTARYATNKVVFRLEGVPVEGTGWLTDPGALSLSATASPNPVNLRVTERSTVTGRCTIGPGAADSSAVLRVQVDGAEIEGLRDVRSARGQAQTYFADLPIGSDFSFRIRRSILGVATVRVFLWSRSLNRTLREVEIPVRFTAVAQEEHRPAVRIGQGGFEIDVGGGTLRIPTGGGRRSEPTEPGGSGTTTTGGGHEGCPPGCTIQH